MLSETFTSKALAVILDGESFEKDELCDELNAALNHCDALKQQRINADIFTYQGRTLILAYPAPPLCGTGVACPVRLVRR